MSEGKSLYQISHDEKTGYRTGDAIHGTESKFDWSNVAQEDKDSGRAVKLPNEIIAGKDCEMYIVKADIATARFGGWKNIMMLSEIKSPGGVSLLKAVQIQTGPVPAEKFKVPAAYKIK